VGTVGHVSDIGGVKDPNAVRELFDEGVLIPPMKLYSAGKPDKSLLRMVQSNVRNPDQVLGDIESLITANALGGQRLLAFMAEYGLEDLATLSSVVQDRSEAATRAAIGARHPGQGPGLHGHAQGVRLLRPQHPGPRRLGPFLHGRRPGRIAAAGWQVWPVVPNLGRQHAGGIARKPHAPGDSGKEPDGRHGRSRSTARRPGPAHAGAPAGKRVGTEPGPALPPRSRDGLS